MQERLRLLKDMKRMNRFALVLTILNVIILVMYLVDVFKGVFQHVGR